MRFFSEIIMISLNFDIFTFFFKNSQTLGLLLPEETTIGRSNTYPFEKGFALRTGPVVDSSDFLLSLLT